MWFVGGLTKRVTVAFLCVASATMAIAYFLRKKLKSLPEKDEEVLFAVSDQKAEYLRKYTDVLDCYDDPSPPQETRRIAHYIRQAERCLDAYVYLSTCEEITDVFVQIHLKGVTVRIVANPCLTVDTMKQYTKLYRFGVEVEMRKMLEPDTTYKFMLIDGRLLIIGRADWCPTADDDVSGLLVTSNSQVIIEFMEYFESMWTKHNA